MSGGKFLSIVSTLGLAIILTTILTYSPRCFSKGNMYKFLRLPDKNNLEVRWFGQNNKDITLKYAMVDKTIFFPDAYNCGTMDNIASHMGGKNPDERIVRVVEQALSIWAEVTHFEFKFVENIDDADIVFGAYSNPKSAYFGRAALRTSDRPFLDTPYLEIQTGAVCLNAPKLWGTGGAPIDNKSLAYLIAHEIGHVIGLNHADGDNHLMSQSFEPPYQKVGLSVGDTMGVQSLYDVGTQYVELD